MAHSQVAILYPEYDNLPILEFRATNNRYFLITPPAKGFSRKTVRMELVQYGYEPTTGMIVTYWPIQTEEEVVEGWKKDEWGKWKRRPTFKRWRQVEFRELEPGELAAVEMEMGNVTTAKRKAGAQRLLQRFRDENHHRFRGVAFEMGEATTPWNPIVLPDSRRVSLIKA